VAAVDVEAVLEAVLAAVLELLDDDELLLPHAAKPILSAVMANSVAALRPRFSKVLHPVADIRRLPLFGLC
jgi:hypothetical protein